MSLFWESENALTICFTGGLFSNQPADFQGYLVCHSVLKWYRSPCSRRRFRNEMPKFYSGNWTKKNHLLASKNKNIPRQFWDGGKED